MVRRNVRSLTMSIGGRFRSRAALSERRSSVGNRRAERADGSGGGSRMSPIKASISLLASLQAPTLFVEVRAVVRLAGMHGLSLGGQLLHLCPNRGKWAKQVLLGGKAIPIRAIGGIDRLLQTNRKILVKTRLRRPILTDDVAGDIIGFLIRQHRRVIGGAKRHVVPGIGSQGQKPAHACSAVVTVRAPERRKLIAKPILRVLSRPVGPVACRANLRIELGTATRIRRASRFLDLQSARADKLGTVGYTGGEPAHIG